MSSKYASVRNPARPKRGLFPFAQDVRDVGALRCAEESGSVQQPSFFSPSVLQGDAFELQVVRLPGEPVADDRGHVGHGRARWTCG